MWNAPEYDDGGYDDTQERYGDTRLGPWDGDPDRDPWTGEWVGEGPEPIYNPPIYVNRGDASDEPPF